MPFHVGGNMCDMRTLLKYAKNHNRVNLTRLAALAASVYRTTLYASALLAAVLCLPETV